MITHWSGSTKKLTPGPVSTGMGDYLCTGILPLTSHPGQLNLAYVSRQNEYWQCFLATARKEVSFV